MTGSEFDAVAVRDRKDGEHAGEDLSQLVSAARAFGARSTSGGFHPSRGSDRVHRQEGVVKESVR